MSPAKCEHGLPIGCCAVCWAARRCDACPDTECPFRDQGGVCPLEEEADYRAYRVQVHGALTGTSAF